MALERALDIIFSYNLEHYLDRRICRYPITNSGAVGVIAPLENARITLARC